MNDSNLKVYIDPTNKFSWRGGLLSPSNKFYNIVDGTEIAQLHSNHTDTLMTTIEIGTIGPHINQSMQ